MRAFVAVELPQALRDVVAAWLDEHGDLLPRARRCRREGLHVTLAFLGEVSEAVVESVGRTLARTSAGVAAFPAALSGGGTFPRSGRRRVAWIGFAEPSRFADLHGAVVEAVERTVPGAVDRRPFHPHVTVARTRRGWSRTVAERWEQAVPERLGASFRVDGAAVMESRPGTDGARYTPRNRVSLAGGSG